MTFELMMFEYKNFLYRLNVKVGHLWRRTMLENESDE